MSKFPPNPKPPEESDAEPSGAPIATSNENQTLLHAGTAISGLKFVTPDARTPVVIIPKGYQAVVMARELFDRWRGRPDRKAGMFQFGDVESFIRYFNEHKEAGSRVFAKISDGGAKFYGIINFHGDEPSFNDHKCAIELTPTLEWTVWLQNAKKQFTQTQFATFLEENSQLFVNPGGLDLVELITNLEGKSHVDITQAIKLQTGAVSLKYSEVVEVRGGASSQAGEMLIPKIIVVSIAPFEGTPHVEMTARLRYRIDNKKIILSYEPVDSHLHVRQLVSELEHTIEQQTGHLPLRVSSSGLYANPVLDDDDY